MSASDNSGTITSRTAPGVHIFKRDTIVYSSYHIRGISMAYLGIGYSGENTSFLRDLVNEQISWLKGDRLPRFFGDSFIVLYDSNTAREFAKKCNDADTEDAIQIYTMDKQRPFI